MDNIYTLRVSEHDNWYSDDARVSDNCRVNLRSRADAEGWTEIWDCDGIVVWAR